MMLVSQGIVFTMPDLPSRDLDFLSPTLSPPITGKVISQASLLLTWATNLQASSNAQLSLAHSHPYFPTHWKCAKFAWV